MSTSGVFVLGVLISCYLAYAIAGGYYSGGNSGLKRPNVTMEEFCPGWGRPADWHIPPATPRPGCCRYADSSRVYFEYLCWKYGWKPPKGWKVPNPIPTKAPRHTFPPDYDPNADDEDYYYYY